MSRLFRQLRRSLRQAANTEWRKRTGKRDWKYELFELKCAFMDTMVYSWLTPIIVFQESVERVIGWLPVIWNDRDWIEGYIFTILQYRIKRARESMVKHSYYALADEYGRQMRVAELLLERLRNSDNYVEQDWKEHFERWPSRWGDCKVDDNGTMTFKERSDEESKDVKRISDKEEYMWQQDFGYLTKHMRKHIRKWGH